MINTSSSAHTETNYAEARRLQTLSSYCIQDSESDPALNQLTAMLGQVFNVPICCVSIVGNSHVQFVSRYGLCTPRIPITDDNLCVHTVRARDLVVISDLSLHPEFRSNPLVCGGVGLRFYAAAPLRTPDGSVIGTVCIMDTKLGSPLTDRDRMLLQSFAATIMGHLELRKQSLRLQQLATANRLLADAVNQTDDAILITDTELGGRGPKIVYANAAFSKMMGYSSDEILGNTPHILRGEKTDAATLKRLGAALLANEPFEGETVKYRKDGSPLFVNWKVSPVREGQGSVTNYIATYRDVTRERAAERKLVEARDRAEYASHAKSDFLAAMSHEVRTPLNGIIGNAELLAQSTLDAQQTEMVTLLRKSGELLLHIVNDILDFSKIEAGRIQLEEMEFSLVDVLRDMVDLLGEAADRKNLELTLEVGNTVPDQVLGDSQRLRQVLLNILSNAVKFTEAGSVRLTVEAEAQSESLVSVTFEVADTGIGIPAESQGKLFESFSQADSSMARRYGGTGLGLAIAKRLLDCMQGSVTVASESNVGSTFTVTVPFKLAAPGSSVDDLQSVIRQNHLTVVSEGSGWLSGTGKQVFPIGMQSLLNGVAEKRFPGRILLDATGSGEDVGYQLAKLAAAIEGSQNRTLVLLPALSRKKVRLLEKAGYRHITAKPLRAKDLTRWLQGESKIATMPAPGDRLSISVLLVEDNLINQKVAKHMLEKLGCTVHVAENGRQAVEMVQRAEFHLVLMDCQMPEMDGIEATRVLRSLGCCTPIVALTAHGLSGDRDRCIAAGMNEYLTKPVQLQELANAVGRWTRNQIRPGEDASTGAGNLQS